MFTSQLANFGRYGVYTSIYKLNGKEKSFRDKFRFRIDDIEITVTQDIVRRGIESEKYVKKSLNWGHTSNVIIDNCDFDRGKEFANDLSSLLSFVTQSSVVAYSYKLDKIGEFSAVNGFVGDGRPVFATGEEERIQSFVEMCWSNYQIFKTKRALSGLFRMVALSDLPILPIETKIGMIFLAIESAKTYFAISESVNLGISEDSNGNFMLGKHKLYFKEIINLMIDSVGMSLESRLIDNIAALRNAIIHRGFLREGDPYTASLFGKLSPPSDVSNLFKRIISEYEIAQDFLREYILRLLGFKGEYCSYSGACRTRSMI